MVTRPVIHSGGLHGKNATTGGDPARSQNWLVRALERRNVLLLRCGSHLPERFIVVRNEHAQLRNNTSISEQAASRAGLGHPL